MKPLIDYLSSKTGEIFFSLGVAFETGQVKLSDRPDLAQFQCNGAMAAAKALKKNPREIADIVKNRLEQDPDIQSVSIAGPGFINITVKDSLITKSLDSMSADERLGIPRTGTGQVILDYGGMNVAKAMHVGHLRPNIIGDCLRSLLRFCGYEALGDVHLGDWGLQMGQIISEFEIRFPGWVYFEATYQGAYPPEPPFSYADLEKIYPEASQACKENPERLEKARIATAELQDGRKGYRALWQHFIDLSLKDIRDNLEPLEIDYDIWKGEACVHPLIAEIAEDLIQRNIAEKSDGALVIPVAKDGDKQDIPPLMFYKSDGAVTYGTTDIATIYERVKLYPALKKIIYVVDFRQNLHFEQVFRACEKAGYTNNIETRHIGNGTVNGPDGKPFKTREGKAMTFRDLVKTVMTKAESRLEEANLSQDLTLEEKRDIAKKVGMAALKFTELSNQPHMDYMFDIEKMTAFEGRTGPYLLYQSVRLQSLLSKAQEQGFDENGAFHLDEKDRAIALKLCDLPNIMDQALIHYSPHYLCEYAYELAQAFSSFYAQCHILSEPDGAIRASRLKLCRLTLRTLKLILSILGLSIPNRM